MFIHMPKPLYGFALHFTLRRKLEMKRAAASVLSLILLLFGVETGMNGASSAVLRPHVLHPPMFFEPNVGQARPGTIFIARGLGSQYLLEANAIVFQQAGVKISMTWSSTHGTVEPLDPLPGKSSYFLGQQNNWLKAIPNYARVRYKSIYRGVDLVFYGSGGNLEYDVVLNPGSDIQDLSFSVSGADRIEVDSSGDLVVKTKTGELRQRRLRQATKYKAATTCISG